MAEVVELRGIHKSYTIGENVQNVLTGTDFILNSAESASIMGPSGCGKSTLMNMIGLLDTPDKGDYFFEGQDVSKLDKNEKASIRNLKIGFVFQSFFLLPRMSALQNVSLPLTYRDLDPKMIEEKASLMLEKVGMLKWAKHKPNELSGGQQQRVAIARALVGEPAVVLADEPTGALDPKIGKAVLDLFINLHEVQNTTLVIITHDQTVAKRCRRQFKLVDGQLVEGANK